MPMTDLTVIEPEPHSEAVVPALERALEMARAGDVSSVAIAIVLRDGTSDAIWSDAPNMVTLIGATARLSHKLHLDVD